MKGRVKQIPDLLKRGWERLLKNAARFAAAIALAAVIYLIDLQLEKKSPDSTTLALVGLGTALLFGVLAPSATGALLKRMTSFKVAGVIEVGMDTAVLAEIVRPPDGEGDGIQSKRNGRDYDDIVKRLKTRMRFVYMITDLSERIESKRSYDEIAHALAADHLLSSEEARFVLDLLSGRDWGLAELPSKAKEEFLDSAWSFADRFHFGVWDRYLRRDLMKRGWMVSDYPQSPGHRRDFLASWNGGRVLMAARVGRPEDPWEYPVTRNRLAKKKMDPPIAGRCIVIPGLDREATVVKKEDDSGRGSCVKVLKLGSLRENPERAFLHNRWNDDAEQRSQVD